MGFWASRLPYWCLREGGEGTTVIGTKYSRIFTVGYIGSYKQEKIKGFTVNSAVNDFVETENLPGKIAFWFAYARLEEFQRFGIVFGGFPKLGIPFWGSLE